jgi:hypothetical protein
MVFDLRLIRRASFVLHFSASVLVASVTGCGSDANRGSEHLRQFIGRWTYRDGLVSGRCGLGDDQISHELKGIEVRIARGTDSDLEVSTGTSCSMKLDVDGLIARARPGQNCTVHIEDATSEITYDTFVLELASSQQLSNSAVGRSQLTIEEVSLECAPFGVDGTLERKASLGAEPYEAPADAKYYVGILPYPDHEHCLTGPGRDPVFFSMDDENDTSCTYWMGRFSIGRWVPPAMTKYPIPQDCRSENSGTWLSFCRMRVEDDTFRPLTTDPEKSHEFYAVLKFGERCPRHSLEISKKIDNEDTDNQNRASSARLLFPNVVTTGVLGSDTRLFFCYFRTAPTEAETMRQFPDLGFSYAVFHDFDGSQPSWVVSKSWRYSDDENKGTANSYYPDARSVEVSQFKEIIENTAATVSEGPNTYFDQARVR